MKMKFYETLEKYKDKEINLIVDMDGVLAEYDIGNFDYAAIRPLKSNIKRIEQLLERQNISITILTICKNDQIILEKKNWFKKYMPFFNTENIVFISKEKEENQGVPSKDLKANYLQKNTNNDSINIVIDDDNEIVKYLVKSNLKIKKQFCMN